MNKPCITFCSRCKKKIRSINHHSILCSKCRRGSDDYVLGFSLIKKAIKERDGNKCLCCLRNIKLLVHHIDKNKRNNKPENLMTLCNQCHMSLHSYYQGKKKGFVRKMKNREFPKVDYQKYGVRLAYVN